MSAKRLLLLDTNVISHALVANQMPAYIKLFAKLEKDYRFVVTGYTKYELTCSSDKKHRDKVEEYLEQNMVYVSLSKALMDFAARLCYLYKNHVSTKGYKIGFGDVVNAAFAAAKPCSVLTIDNNDYPTPFFIEEKRLRVEYKSKKGTDMIDTICLLSPDLTNVKECFDKHEI